MLTRRNRAQVLLLGIAIPLMPAQHALADSALGGAHAAELASTTCDSTICHEEVDVPSVGKPPQHPLATSSKDAIPDCRTKTIALYYTPTVVDERQASSEKIVDIDPDDPVQGVCVLRGQVVSSHLIFKVPDERAQSAGTLAQQAYGNLVPPTPDVQMNPAANIPQLTGLPVWLSLKPGTWIPKTSSVSAGGVTVTATATPQSVTWSMGDGSTITCAGPGTPYHEEPGSDGLAPSPDCGHTYHQTSADQPGGTFDVTATIAWHVVWSGAGKGGEFPNLRSSARVRVRVIEASALVTANRN